MPADAPRTGPERKADVLAKLEARHADAWVASASPGGKAHLVPLSYAWDGVHLVLALDGTSVTARNIAALRRARIALGGTRDVVMIDATLEERVEIVHAAATLADGYSSQADWDPRGAGEEYVFLLLRPERIQAWREANEIAGRAVMRAGAWLV
jgi:hypothetical protein